MNVPRILVLVGALGAVSSAALALPVGWSVEGNAGITTAPDGVVEALPGISEYYYVSTSGGIRGVGALDGVGGEEGGPSDGSVLTTSIFSAAAGSSLAFFFNYVTSDGAGFEGTGYADYAWARLVNGADQIDSTLLLTVRTTPDGDTVPGFSMPGLAAGMTLEPASTPIIPGNGDGSSSGPIWSELGSDSGWCYIGVGEGCGFTGWIKVTYEFAASGDYRLQFGVTNWFDTAFDSGMAIAGIMIDDNSGGGVVAPIPLPAAGWLLLGGLGALAVMQRRRRRT